MLIADGVACWKRERERVITKVIVKLKLVFNLLPLAYSSLFTKRYRYMSASLVVAHVQKIKTLPHLHMEKFYFRTIACKSGKIDLPLYHRHCYYCC